LPQKEGVQAKSSLSKGSQSLKKKTYGSETVFERSKSIKNHYYTIEDLGHPKEDQPGNVKRKGI